MNVLDYHSINIISGTVARVGATSI